MENLSDFASRYIQFLKRSLPAAKEASGGTEIVCRCQYCPDSTDPSHGHMYISIPQNDEDISVFYCQKCHTSGLVNNRTLMEWGCYDPEISTALGHINQAAEKYGRTKGYNREIYNIKNHIYNTQLAEFKLQYINQRLGINMAMEQALQEKIIFNIGDVLDFNKIQNYTRHLNIVKQLNDNFVGFLSLDNNFVNMRRICDKGIVYESIDKRYVNYNIFGKKDNTEKFYTLPCEFNPAIPERIKVHIAEGPMDILSIKYNLRKEYALYSAVGGSGYKGLIMYLMNTMKLWYIELHLYPDNDSSGSDRKINQIVQYLVPYHIPIYVHRNIMVGQKDMGVSADKIQESIIKLNNF